MPRHLAALFFLVCSCNRGAISGAGAAGRVVCGQAECKLATGEICCDDYVHGPQCTTSCPIGDWLTCDGPEDCSSAEECCDSFDAAGSSTASCIPKSAPCSAKTLCHRDADCPAGVGCAPINPQLYPGVGACRESLGLDQ